MDAVHTTRDEVSADVVMLILPGAGGQAYSILTPSNASAANAFARMGILHADVTVRAGDGTTTESIAVAITVTNVEGPPNAPIDAATSINIDVGG